MPKRKVIHPRYGLGIVLQTRHKGFELRVDFGGEIRWVRLDELKEIDALRPPETHPLNSEPNEHFKSRRMIEAFRLGVVPYDCVDEFTFGRDEETKQLMQWLFSDEGSLFIIGEYGSGKTHLLHYAIGRAIREKFAVSWVEMDPNEFPFHRPKSIYRQFVQNFKYPLGDNTRLEGFRHFLKKVLATSAFRDHLYFKHLNRDVSDEFLWEWIEARESTIRPGDPYNLTHIFLPGLYDYSTAANIYCYLLSALGWAAKEIIGLKGLLLVFDEAETVEINYYSYQAERGRNFLRALIHTASNDQDLLQKPWNSGLDYCRRGVGPNIPFIYKTPCGLKILFSFTQRPRFIPEIEDFLLIDLEPLSDEALKQVFEHICLLYDSAYDFLEEDVTIEILFKELNTQIVHTRLFVKGAVEVLDLARLSRDENIVEEL